MDENTKTEAFALLLCTDLCRGTILLKRARVARRAGKKEHILLDELIGG